MPFGARGVRSGVRIMTPGQARIALLSFLLVTGGVAINELFLQGRPAASAKTGVERPPSRPAVERGRKLAETPPDRPGVRGPDGPAGERALRIARFAPTSTNVDALPEAPPEDAGAETISAI